MTTDSDKSTNPPTKTAADTASASSTTEAPTLASGHEGTVRDQIEAYRQRVRGGEMGSLPALAGVVIIAIVFFIATPFFITKTNIANLMTQTAGLMMLSMALTFVIILAEIDLSAGVTGGRAFESPCAYREEAASARASRNRMTAIMTRAISAG